MTQESEINWTKFLREQGRLDDLLVLNYHPETKARIQAEIDKASSRNESKSIQLKDMTFSDIDGNFKCIKVYEYYDGDILAHYRLDDANFISFALGADMVKGWQFALFMASPSDIELYDTGKIHLPDLFRRAGREQNGYLVINWGIMNDRGQAVNEGVEFHDDVETFIKESMYEDESIYFREYGDHHWSLEDENAKSSIVKVTGLLNKQ